METYINKPRKERKLVSIHSLPLTEIGIVSATYSESSKRFIYSTGVSE